MVAYEAAGLWIARRRGRAAARLHVRIVLLFSFIAALPAILMAVIAAITLNEGLDRWFAQRTEAIIETSRSVAQAYVQEHSRVLALDLLAIAGEFNRVTPDIDQNAAAIAAYLTNQANAARPFGDPAHPPRPQRDRRRRDQHQPRSAAAARGNLRRSRARASRR